MADKWDINLASSWMVGDTGSDTQTGRAAGCRTILIDAFYNQGMAVDFRANNLTEALEIINGKK